MSSGKKELSETWFEDYLRSTGHDGWQVHHPDLGTQQRPDYRAQKSGDVAVCEVKEFTTSAMQRAIAEDDERREWFLRETGIALRPRLRGIGPKQQHKAVRRQIKEGAPQLKEVAPRGMPLV